MFLFVIGGPSSGKTLLSQRLKELCNFTPLTVESLVKQEAEASNGSSTGLSSSSSSTANLSKELAKMLECGVEVDLETCLDLLRTAALKALRCGTLGIIVDGFPKNLQQVSCQ